MKLKNILLSIVASSVMVVANSSDAIQMSSVAFEEVVVAGKESTLKPLEKAVPGMIVTYVNTIKNSSNDVASNLVVVNPIPNDTIYVANSADAEGVSIEYSIDGKEFNKPGKVMIKKDGLDRLAQAHEYKHIRWTIAKLAGNSEFKVKFQSKIK